LININDILNYFPTEHGEHGVDSVLHSIVKQDSSFDDSYGNPPGGAWSQIIIKKPSDRFYIWDNIPREPKKAKRPDLIIQFNDKKTINLLIIESKKKEKDIYNNIHKLLKNFFKGSKNNYAGLFASPSNITINVKTKKMTYMNNVKNKKFDPFWIKKSKVQLFTGFAFAFKPEVYTKKEDFDSKSYGKIMDNMCKKHNLDVVIGVGWEGKQHFPFVSYSCSNKFKKTVFYSKFKSTFSSLEVQP
jgi:hypothetical protein